MLRGKQIISSFIVIAFAVIFACALSYIVRAEQKSVNPVVAANSAERDRQSKQGDLRVVSFNIRHAKGLDERVDLNRTLQLLKRTEADVIALQEVDRYQIRSGFQDQAAFLARGLHMDWRFSASVDGAVGQYGNAILSRYPIIDQEVHYLPGKERRSILCVTLRKDERMLTVVTTHLAVQPQERRLQMPILLDFLRTTSGPAVLTGDFNMESPNTLMSGLSKEWRQTHLQEPAQTLAGGGEFDHIFVKGPLSAAQTRSIMSDVSDHFPIVADLVK